MPPCLALASRACLPQGTVYLSAPPEVRKTLPLLRWILGPHLGSQTPAQRHLLKHIMFAPGRSQALQSAHPPRVEVSRTEGSQSPPPSLHPVLTHGKGAMGCSTECDLIAGFIQGACQKTETQQQKTSEKFETRLGATPLG